MIDDEISTQPTKTPQEVVKGRSLTTHTFHGILWNVLGSVMRQSIALGSSIVVARQLMPRDFAIAGLGATVTGVVTAMSAQGFATALIREPHLKPSKCHSVFWFLLAVGIGLSARPRTG